MTGYTCLVDQKKDEEQKKFECWSKIVTPSSNGNAGESLYEEVV